MGRTSRVGLVLLLSSLASAQSGNAKAQVEALIAHERYCSVGSRSASLLITFTARLDNTSDTLVELSLPTYPVARVAHSLSDLDSHEYEAILHVPLIVKRKGASPDFSSQTPIKPGEKLEFKTMEITFPLSLRETDRTGDLGFGIHFVKLEFSLWNPTTQHFDKTESKPIEVKIERMSGLRPCM